MLMTWPQWPLSNQEPQVSPSWQGAFWSEACSKPTLASTDPLITAQDECDRKWIRIVILIYWSDYWYNTRCLMFFFFKILIYFDDFFKHFFHRSVPSCLKALPFCCTAVRTTWREIHHLLLMKSRVSTNFDTLTSLFYSFLVFINFQLCWINLKPKRTWVPKFASGSSFSAALPRSSSKPSRWMANNKSSRSPPHAYTEPQPFCASDTSDTLDDTWWYLMTTYDP